MQSIVSRRMLSLFVLIFASLAVCPAYANNAEQCTPEFPFKDGWWGGDAAYSIPLADGRTVWIFGDTLYGDKRVVVGKDPRMTHNSIGISTCKNGKWNVEYVIKRSPDGAPADFFPPRVKGTWYWALDGVRVKDELWITLLCIRPSTSSESEALGFETCGADLARVRGLGSDAQKWQVTNYPLVADGVKAYPSSTTVVEGKHLYLFALYESGKRPLLVTRIPLAGLNAPAKNLQYLAKGGKWKPGFKPEDAQEVMAQGNSEMSIRYHAGRKQWLAVLNEPGLFTDKILLRTAPNLTGPWTDGQVIYRIPDVQKDAPGYDPDTFCYAGKEHPQFRQADSVLVTYACNTQKVAKLTTNLNIYYPKAVRITLPKPVESSASSN